MWKKIMSTNRIIILPLFLIPLFFISACERQNRMNATNSSRILYGADEHDKEFGNYIIHINALTTDQLPSEIARGYKISRSKNQGMLNVSVRERQKQMEVPVTATISVIAKNLSSQLKSIELREVREVDSVAIYYIGELSVGNEETLVFDIDVKPVGSTKTFLVSYRQKFFTSN